MASGDRSAADTRPNIHMLRRDLAAAFRAAVRRRLKHEPLQYIMGSAAFRQLELTVDTNVLIPRPETEVLAGCAIGNKPPATYDLIAPRAFAGNKRPAPYQLVVLQPEATGALDTNRLMVRPKADQISYYKGVAWSDSLPSLVQARLIESFQNSGAVKSVSDTAGQYGLATEIRAFQKILLDAGVLTMVRRTRGDDIDAACGQLKGQVLDRTRRQAEFRRRLDEGNTPHAA